MYENMIEVLNPKPRFNLTWYNDADLYSEGEIEDVIVDIIAHNEPEDYVQAIADHYCWSVFYHLTHIRKNILNWYPFSKESSVLEIGCGLGAITGLLCDKCKDVTAVELSKKRATGTLLRCREKENLEIIVGNLNDIQFEKKFDYITLIGVLEYQGSFTNTENPYLDFLKKIKGLLKPDGKVLIAIENQYGLKYWCGAREDHTGLPFEGLNQYTISNKKVRTFSKSALDNLVKNSGFKNAYFYYPMPDYKLPTVIYSSKKLPANRNMMDMRYYYIPDGSTLIAQEENIYKDIIDNKVFEFFANSFLVECSDSSQLGEISFASLSSHKFEEYRTGIKFNDKNEVIKYALQSNTGTRHLEQMLRYERELQERGLHVWSSAFRDEELVMGYCNARTVEEVLINEYYNMNIDKIY
ncbi:MAG: class I SAM-dependent methyltransferase, partial [Lachnospiraceae bacterium]|nr:class I SAM-dependent methyltransferase [Lachnospiraceae bacterium]